METDNIRRHCPEVENLMGGKMPFVTRCGITIVVIVLFVIVALLLSEGASQQLMKEMIEHTIEQIMSKIY